MLPSTKSSRADRRVKARNFSSVPGTDSVLIYRVLRMGTEFVSEKLEKIHTLKLLSVREDFIECSSHVSFKACLCFLGYDRYEIGLLLQGTQLL
jgi:hypothetical protein